jgi:hypothetical protein
MIRQGSIVIASLILAVGVAQRTLESSPSSRRVLWSDGTLLPDVSRVGDTPYFSRVQTFPDVRSGAFTGCRRDARR